MWEKGPPSIPSASAPLRDSDGENHPKVWSRQSPCFTLPVQAAESGGQGTRVRDTLSAGSPTFWDLGATNPLGVGLGRAGFAAPGQLWFKHPSSRVPFWANTPLTSQAPTLRPASVRSSPHPLPGWLVPPIPWSQLVTDTPTTLLPVHELALGMPWLLASLLSSGHVSLCLSTSPESSSEHQLPQWFIYPSLSPPAAGICRVIKKLGGGGGVGGW